MSTPASYLDVYWKIKNFNPCCEVLRSPEFSFSGYQHCGQLNMDSVDIQCVVLRKTSVWKRNFEVLVSLETCDGSPEESISSGRPVPLEVIFGSRRNAFLSEDTLAVRFRLKTKNERGKLFICSQIGMKRKYFLWSMKSQSNCQFNKERCLETSELYGKVKLDLKSEGGINSVPQFSIEISRNGGERCYCVLEVSLLDVDGKAVYKAKIKFIFEKKDGTQTKNLPPIINKSKCIGYKKLLITGDTLSLQCYFAIYLGTVADQSAVISHCLDDRPLLKKSDDLSMILKGETNSASFSKLQTDLERMLENGPLFDVCLQIGSEIIQAHKSILSARSPVFKAMFTNDMQESIKNTVVIEDFGVETMRRLLLYIYTDSVRDDQWENIKMLYLAADKYEVLCLKEKCMFFLKAKLSIRNVGDSLVLADLHQEVDLKTLAIDFISENDSAVFASEEWNEFEKNNCSLALKCMREICRNKRIKFI